MNNMGTQAVFAFLLLLMATVNAEEGKVEFHKTKFTMTCPIQGTEWYKNEDNITKSSGFESEFTQEYNSDNKGFYYCVGPSNDAPPKKIRYYFYVKGKVCENCYEVDSFVIGLAVAVDVVITLCVMMLIYTCAQNKNPEASVPAPRVPARSGGQVPTSQTYESLNPNTRANDTYSKVNRTG